jgi:two-component system OmpR family sensor kinase
MPIRLRLTLVFALGMAVVLAGFGVFVYERVGRDLLAIVDLGLRARMQPVSSQDERTGPEAIGSTQGLIDPDESFAQILDASGRLVEATAHSGGPLLSVAALASVRGPSFFVRTVPAIDTDPVRLLVVPVTSSGRRLFVVVGATLGDRKDSLERLVASLAVGGPVLLILVSAAGWILIGGALRPVERMRQEADAVSASEPDRRLPISPAGDELARLGLTLNKMLDRIQEALHRERRFVDDASHELRTPLSILKMELDLAMARARTPQELEGALRNAAGETDRLVRLAEDLLVLARVERGRLPVHREEVSLPDLVGESASRYAELARMAGARIELDVQPGIAWLDPARLRQALENLVDNAVRHSPQNGVVRIRAGRTGDAVTVTVEDSGPGFQPDLLDRAFEPFARGDPAGNGSGAGLGLSIVQAVVEAHDGTVRAENRPDGGARITMSLRSSR